MLSPRQRRNRKAGPAPVSDRATIAREGFRGPAQAVPHRQKMESGFGVDFGSVQAYTGPAAAKACKQLGAEAFAMGNQVAFRDASPSSAVVAHELTHVRQQSPKVQAKSSSTQRSEGTAEVEADRMAAIVAGGGKVDAASIGSESSGQVRGLWDEASEWWDEKTDAASEWVDEKTDAASEWVDEKTDAAAETWDDVKEGASETWEDVKDSASETWEDVKEGASETWEDVKEGASETWEDVKEGASDAWEGAKEGASDAWEGAKEAWQGVGDKESGGKGAGQSPVQAGIWSSLFGKEEHEMLAELGEAEDKARAAANNAGYAVGAAADAVKSAASGTAGRTKGGAEAATEALGALGQLGQAWGLASKLKQAFGGSEYARSPVSGNADTMVAEYTAKINKLKAAAETAQKVAKAMKAFESRQLSFDSWDSVESWANSVGTAFTGAGALIGHLPAPASWAADYCNVPAKVIASVLPTFKGRFGKVMKMGSDPTNCGSENLKEGTESKQCWKDQK